MIEQIKPMDIEKRSFEIITEILGDRRLDPENELVIKRVIHTSADFDYADNLVFSEHAVTKGIEALRGGCDIVTDTQMAKSGINKTILGKLGGEVHCFMSDADVAAEAKDRGITRAIVSMEHAAQAVQALHFRHRQCAHGADFPARADHRRQAESGTDHRRSRGLCERGGKQGADHCIRCSLYRCPWPQGRQQCGCCHLQRHALPDHALNVMEEYVLRDGKRLRMGYTTGSCAAAAAKAAAWMLLTGQRRAQISLVTPKGITLNLSVLEIQMGETQVSCAIEKDSGDDPDITKGTLIFATVTKVKEPGIFIDGGYGIGRVTKRGLDQPVGNAAINSVPRKMIRENIEQVCALTDYKGGLSVVISAPEGEMLAKKTFNPRLGIVGGISILGTTGIVEPMSEKALVDTIRVELRQKKENGADYVLLTPGNYGSDFIRLDMGIDAKAAVQVSNFIGDALDICKELGLRGALLIGHIGKLVKIGGGMLNTHSKYGDCRMEILAAQAGAEGLASQEICQMLDCATCDDALRILKEAGFYEQTLSRLTGRVAFHLNHRGGEQLQTGAILFSKEYGILGKSENADKLLELILEDL